MKIESMSSKDVTTKFGTKKTFSFKADGEWYKCGFKKPPFKEGDEVEFTYVDGTYGKDVNMDSIHVVSGGVAPKAPTAAPYSAPPPRSAFPISPLDGQRSIIRQNCVGNAKELFIAQQGKGMDKLSMDEIVTNVIHIARKLEAYAAGDLDLAVAKEKVDGLIKDVSM